MSIRLNKAAKELKVGIQTMVQYLNSFGYTVEADPSARISDDEFAILSEKFGGERIWARRWNYELMFTDDPKTNRMIVNTHHWNELKSDTMIIFNYGCVLIPKDQTKDKYPFWTKEDIVEKCPNAIDGSQVKKKYLSEPSYYIPVEPLKPRIEAHPKATITDTRKIAIDFHTVGRIDLDALNTSTRPARNPREEKKRKREEKKSLRVQNVNKTSISPAPESEHQITANTIRDIWQKYVVIQEQLIKQRSVPISIIKDSIEVENNKLYVKVDNSHSENTIKSILTETLGVTEYDLEAGYVYVDEEKWDTLPETELERIRKELSECYIELDTTPEINVSINYAKYLGRTDQLSIDELKQLDLIINESGYLEGHIDDTVAFISKVSVMREDYLRFLFGNHYVISEKKSKEKEETVIVDYIEYTNQYIPWNVIQQYSNIGLFCSQYTIIIQVNNERAKEELKNIFDCFSSESDSFEFKRQFTLNDPCHKDYIDEVNDNIKSFMDEAYIYCPEDNIKVNVQFIYKVNKLQLVRDKLKEVGAYVSSFEEYSFNEETGAIGIDFNWRQQNPDLLIQGLEKEIPFIKVNVHEEHRYKCKVDTHIVGFEELKSKLEEKYEDISVENDSINHVIRIRLPYVDAESYDPLCIHLRNDLSHLSAIGAEISFAAKENGKIRLNLKYNSQSRLEDLEESILNMRKAEFGFMLGEKEISFGKLLKVNYPDLVFDIDVPETIKDEVMSAFEAKAIDTIIPILTGELEKISRLKKSFTKAASGQELINPRLQRFIFDSSMATITDDIDTLLRHDGPIYREICVHLLNEQINESQKQAIIKAMFSEDLSVIQGPPGTGKSTAIAELIWQLIRRGYQNINKKERILLTSETNLAVDNAISRIVNDRTNLVKPIRFGGEEKLESEGLQFSIELMKKWVEEGDECLKAEESDEESDTTIEYDLILKNWLNNISKRSFYGVSDDDNDIISKWRNYLEKPNKELREATFNRYLEGANVVGATCSSIGDKRAGENDFNGFTPFFYNYCEVFKKKLGKARIEFTTVIQDESSKATPAELVLPFVYGERAIVIGDHRQLPPMLDREEFEETLEYALKICKEDEREEILRLSQYVDEHFDEMEISHFQKLYENIDSSLKGSFNLQYRMHPDINEVIEQFYRADGGLKCGLIYPKDLGVNNNDVCNPTSRYHGIDIPGIITPDTHVVFINSSSPEMLDGTSRVNYGEVETIDKLLTLFEESPSFQTYLSKLTKEDDKQIGIISFYGKQIKQLRSISHKHPNLPIRVSTVDRFQGMERNIIIVSMVRSNIIQSSKNQQPDKKRYPEYGYPVQKSLGFAQSPNRLNVALSRAKRLLVIIGNRDLFSNLDIYQRLFLTIESNRHNKVLNQNEL